MLGIKNVLHICYFAGLKELYIMYINYLEFSIVILPLSLLSISLNSLKFKLKSREISFIILIMCSYINFFSSEYFKVLLFHSSYISGISIFIQLLISFFAFIQTPSETRRYKSIWIIIANLCLLFKLSLLNREYVIENIFILKYIISSNINFNSNDLKLILDFMSYICYSKLL